MADYQTVIAGGTVVTGTDVFRADIGINNGIIAAIGLSLKGETTIDAGGLVVLPGGVDSHCHIEQLNDHGGSDEETWTTGSTSALAGGTTSVITFAAQFKGHGILDTMAEYRRRASKAMVDYSFHQIISDASDEVMFREVPQIVAAGVRSLKVFLTYENSYLDDRHFIRVLAAARRNGAIVTVHCENYEAINWRTKALLAAGLTEPKYHAWSRPVMIEREATHRAIALAEMIDVPIQIFHVSCAEVAEEVARAQHRGLKVWAETCPQYLTKTASDMDRQGFEGAKYMCSPAPRDAAAHAGQWEMIRRGTLDVISSDHSGWSYDSPVGKRAGGPNASFRDIPNGMPGLGSRMSVLFSEGVAKGHIDLCQFAKLTATNPAKLFGLPGKGSIAPGMDADLVLWDATRKTTITNAHMQHIIDYTPYEGMEVTGWPVSTIRRGEVVMKDDKVLAQPGSGKFLARGPYDMIKPLGRLPDGFDGAAYEV